MWLLILGSVSPMDSASLGASQQRFPITNAASGDFYFMVPDLVTSKPFTWDDELCGTLAIGARIMLCRLGMTFINLVRN